jgi:NAD(P)-dependent dehydrogenase (short-subunit alcohol dehydrogenase family)
MNSILVNNAGISEHHPVSMATFDSIWRQVEVNFKGARDVLFKSYNYGIEIRWLLESSY